MSKSPPHANISVSIGKTKSHPISFLNFYISANGKGDRSFTKVYDFLMRFTNSFQGFRLMLRDTGEKTTFECESEVKKWTEDKECGWRDSNCTFRNSRAPPAVLVCIVVTGYRCTQATLTALSVTVAFKC